MKTAVSIALVALLAACGGEPAAPKPANTPEGRLCGRAYGSTVDSLSKLYKKAGVELPDTLPTRETYVNKCVELGFTEDQVRCLDPKLEQLDPAACKTTIEPVKAKKEQLDKLFKDAFEAAQKKEEARPEEAAADGAATEGPADGPMKGKGKGKAKAKAR